MAPNWSPSSSLDIATITKYTLLTEQGKDNPLAFGILCFPAQGHRYRGPTLGVAINMSNILNSAAIPVIFDPGAAGRPSAELVAVPICQEHFGALGVASSLVVEIVGGRVPSV